MADETKTTATATLANAPAAVPAMRDPQTLVLRRSGITVVYEADYRTGDMLIAQKAAKDATNFLPYLVQRIALFDGRRWTTQEILEKLPGKDFTQLTAYIFKDDDAGND